MTPKHNPIASLGRSSLGKRILIKCKRQKKFLGKLISYDIHLNLALEDVEYTYHERKYDEEDENKYTYVEKNETLNKIIVRGDSIVFIGLNSK